MAALGMIVDDGELSRQRIVRSHRECQRPSTGTEPADRRVQSRLTDHLTEEPYSEGTQLASAAITVGNCWLGYAATVPE
jgi:hypothetical protein